MKSSLALASIFAMSLCGGLSLPAHADDDDDNAAPKPAWALAPTDDVYGFTSPTDLGDPGDRNFSNENDFRFGKRGGSYFGLNNKFELSYTINKDWWIAASPFLAFNALRGVPGLADKNTAAFDGFSFEIAHRFLVRDENNPWQITATVEPRWSRIDPESGFAADSKGFAAKIFVDRILAPNLSWAANLQWAPQWSSDPFVPHNTLLGSQTTVSSAVSWQFAPNWFLALEAQYLTAFNRILPDHLAGQALYVGPALAWKISEKTAVNVVLEPQVWGRSSASPNLALDLDNFEHALFRLKFVQQF